MLRAVYRTTRPWHSVRTVALVHGILEQNLREYFENTLFQLQREGHVPQLRKAMEIVYLRKTPLISLDVEVDESHHDRILEVGVSMYDPEGQETLLMPHINTLHFVSKEYRNKRNFKYVPDRKFGYNGAFTHVLPLADQRDFLREFFTNCFQERGAVLVGHACSGDIKWIRLMGVPIPEEPFVIDTLKIQGYSRAAGKTLRDLLRQLDILHANLHNASNDAYYTLLSAFTLLDPAHRRRLRLDTYSAANPLEGMSLKEKRVAAYKKKFSDRAELLMVPPAVGDYDFGVTNSRRVVDEGPELTPEERDKLALEQAAAEVDRTAKMMDSFMGR